MKKRKKEAEGKGERKGEGNREKREIERGRRE